MQSSDSFDDEQSAKAEAARRSALETDDRVDWECWWSDRDQQWKVLALPSGRMHRGTIAATVAAMALLVVIFGAVIRLAHVHGSARDWLSLLSVFVSAVIGSAFGNWWHRRRRGPLPS